MCAGRPVKFSVTALNSTVLANPEIQIVRVPSLPGGRGVGHFFHVVRDEQVSCYDEVHILGAVPSDVRKAGDNAVMRLS